VLASQSPRRRELLSMLGLSFKVAPASKEPPLPLGVPLEEAILQVALGKTLEYDLKDGELVVGADTLVYLDGTPFGKPRDAGEAFSMLRSLSGREHSVLTGLAVRSLDKQVCACETTFVRFSTLSDAEITAYVSSGESLDKAGAYAAQGLGAMLIDRIDGDFFNVIGLPLRLLYKMLAEFGINILDPEDGFESN
jgi:septum formation protein